MGPGLMNKISLIIPCYKSNIEQLNQALEYSHLFDETIVHINDYETLTNFRFNRKDIIIIYRDKQVTVQEALNEAIYFSSGNWILPFSDDDFFQSEPLSRLLNFVRSYDDIANDIFRYPIYAGNEKDGWHLWGNKEKFDLEDLIDENYIPFSCLMKKDIWNKVEGFKAGPFSDWKFWLECAKNKAIFHYWDDVIYNHRESHKETLSNRESINFNKEEFLKGLYE